MELQASVVYRQLSIQMEVASLPGFAQWFRAQAQEEATVEEICDQVRLVRNDGPGLLRLDNELGSRELETG